MLADVQDVQRPRAFGDQVGPLQTRHCLREGVARRRLQPAAGYAELAGQGGQGADRPDRRAAVAVPLQPVAEVDRRRARLAIPLGDGADIIRGHAANFRRALHRIRPRQGHEFLEPVHVLLDEIVIEAAGALQFAGQRPGQHHIGARPDRQEKVGLLRRLDPFWVDHDDLRALLARRVEPAL